MKGKLQEKQKQKQNNPTPTHRLGKQGALSTTCLLSIAPYIIKAAEKEAAQSTKHVFLLVSQEAALKGIFAKMTESAILGKV